MSEIHDVIILGSGPAGCTASIYTARAGLNTLMLKGPEPGGQLTITTDVENYPGFADPIQGPDLMDAMMKQAENCGAKVKETWITDVDFSNRPFTLTAEDSTIYQAKSVIISTGASARWLGLESEEKYRGFGVSACATCDGFFYKNKEVIVVGGGNTAVEEALYLSNIASKVYLVHRRDELRSEKILQKRLLANPKIQPVWDSQVKEIIGEAGILGSTVTGAIIENVKTGEETTINVPAVFIAIGHTPNTQLFKNILDMDQSNFLITKNNSTATNIKGIFACGDVQDPIYQQAVTAAGSGCMSALEVEKFLAEED